MNPTERYINFFVSLTPQSLPQLDTVFTVDARFKDPFNDVCGHAAIKTVFEHMFAQVQQPRFQVINAAVVDKAEGSEQDIMLLEWRFTFSSSKGRAFSWLGVSRVCFNEAGQATEHIDYWDPAENVYAHVPLIGRVLRFLRNRLTAK